MTAIFCGDMNLPTALPLVTALQLGQQLRMTRKQLKLNQKTVGHRLGLSQNRISYLELHPEELSLRQLLAWCAVLKLELRLGYRETAMGPAAQTEW